MIQVDKQEKRSREKLDQATVSILLFGETGKSLCASSLLGDMNSGKTEGQRQREVHRRLHCLQPLVAPLAKVHKKPYKSISGSREDKGMLLSIGLKLPICQVCLNNHFILTGCLA